MHVPFPTCRRPKRLAAPCALVFLLQAWPVVAAPADSLTFEIVADDMCCSGCAKKVAGQLYTAPGVVNVKADVAKRLVVVTARPSRKLTLQKLWQAVEKAKGGPSQLSTNGTTYVLTRFDALPEAERSLAYKVTLAASEDSPSADALTKGFARALPAAGEIQYRPVENALLLAPPRGTSLSPWTIAATVEQIGLQPVAIDGPHGRLSVERVEAGELTARPRTQGEVR